MTQRPHLVLPVGRYVQGSMTQMQTTDHQNNPLPAEKHHYWFGVAVRKDDPQVDQHRAQIAAYAMEDFAQAPHIQTLIQQYNYAPNSGFAWKIKDGDVPEPGKQVNPNLAGHWIFGFRTGYAIKCCDQQNAVIPAENITKGWFVQVAYSVTGNGQTTAQAGVYLNPLQVRFVAHGEEIQEGMTADQAFANHQLPTQLPPGASLTPVAPGPMAVPPGNATSPVPGQQPTAPVLPPATPTAQPNTNLMTGSPGNVQPHPTFANGPQAPTAAPAAAPAIPSNPNPAGGMMPGVAPGNAAPGIVSNQPPAVQTGAPVPSTPGAVPGAPVAQ